MSDFMVKGVPVGTDPAVKAAHAYPGSVYHRPRQDALPQEERGSIIVILGTDAPLMPHQLNRLARRATIGIGRLGSPGGNGSGDIFLAFSTANAQGGIPTAELSAAKFPTARFEYMHDDLTDRLYLAAVQAVEEAILNALCAAEPMSMVKPAAGVIPALDHAALREVLRRHGRLAAPSASL